MCANSSPPGPRNLTYWYDNKLVLFLLPAQCKHGVTQWAAGVKIYV